MPSEFCCTCKLQINFRICLLFNLNGMNISFSDLIKVPKTCPAYVNNSIYCNETRNQSETKYSSQRAVANNNKNNVLSQKLTLDNLTSTLKIYS